MSVAARPTRYVVIVRVRSSVMIDDKAPNTLLDELAAPAIPRGAQHEQLSRAWGGACAGHRIKLTIDRPKLSRG